MAITVKDVVEIAPKKVVSLQQGKANCIKKCTMLMHWRFFIFEKECPVVWSEKIENLTGYDLSDPESILELSLALRLKKFMNQ